MQGGSKEKKTVFARCFSENGNVHHEDEDGAVGLLFSPSCTNVVQISTSQILPLAENYL